MIVRGRFLCSERVEDVNYVKEICKEFYTEKKVNNVELSVTSTMLTFKALTAITTNQLMWMLKENVKSMKVREEGESRV